MIFFSSILNDIQDGWRSLLLLICEPIYKLISYLYKLFESISTAEILTAEQISSVFDRISLILGVYMLFRLILSFVQYLINPDYITDKEKGVGNLAKKAILVVVLLGITPTLFSKAIELQNMVVGAGEGENVIAKIILPSGTINDFDSFGSELSAYLFTTFYKYDDPLLANHADYGCEALDIEVAGMPLLKKRIVDLNGDLNLGYNCLSDKYNVDTIHSGARDESRYTISFSVNGLFAVIVGIIICYFFISYCLMAGVRVIQLTFFRIIAPMAILSYLSPKKDTMFEKWLKMCSTTYLDLFIRMAIIYFVICIINLMVSSDVGIALMTPFDDMWLIQIVLILALLTFAKKAPELIKELLPKSGAASLGFGLKSPKKIFDDMLGGKQILNGAKRVYGGAAVGFMAGSLAARKGVGKLFDMRGDVKKTRDKINAIKADASLSDEAKRERIRAERAKMGKAISKQLWRTTAGSVYTGLGGARRGVMTTDKGGRKTATDNAYKRVQSTYKLRDAGYSWSQQQMDNVRGFFERDREIEDIIAANEAALHSLNTRLMKEEELNTTGYTVQKSKRNDTYLIIGPDGKPLDGGRFYSETEAKAEFDGLGIDPDDVKKIFKPAKTQEQIGKLQGQNSALKFEEQKKDKK